MVPAEFPPSRYGVEFMMLTCFGNRREIRRPQVDRLVELLQQRRNLQDKLEHCFDTLGQAWTATNRQVEQAVRDCEELSDASDQDG